MLSQHLVKAFMLSQNMAEGQISNWKTEEIGELIPLSEPHSCDNGMKSSMGEEPS
jgi:hypothetical protein